MREKHVETEIINVSGCLVRAKILAMVRRMACLQQSGFLFILNVTFVIINTSQLMT